LHWLTLLGIAFGLAMDAFAVSIAVGMSGAADSGRPMFRMAFHFGLFQFMMPILGWLAGTLSAVGIHFGSRLGPRCGRWAELLGGCVLLLIGARILLTHLAVG
jgi:putative Mn2+ efflux pump MntP